MREQIRREHCSQEQMAHLEGVLFPLVARLKVLARERREGQKGVSHAGV